MHPKEVAYDHYPESLKENKYQNQQ